MTIRRKAVRCPPQSKWHLLASTPAAALLMEGSFAGWYLRRDEAGEIIPCRNGHLEPRSSALQAGKDHGECRGCRRNSNDRAHGKEMMSDPDKRARKLEQDRARNAGMAARGLLSGQAPQYRTPPWSTPAKKKAVRAFMKRAKENGQHVDHLGPVDHTKEDNLISGLHVRWNLKAGAGRRNNSKGGKLPDPDTLRWPPRRAWTLDDMRREVREGRDVWSHDVDTSVRPKERWKEPRVRWDLYQRDPKTGLINYTGFEPTMLVGNAALRLDLQALADAGGNVSKAARARGLPRMTFRDRLVEAANRGLGRAPQ